MLTLKRKKVVFSVLLALLGLGYFSAMSSLEINFLLKGYISVMPLQALAIIYVLYFQWKAR